MQLPPPLYEEEPPQPEVPQPVVNRTAARQEYCRSVLQKHPIEMYSVRAVAREGIPDNLRAAYWRVLLGYLPLRRERWESAHLEAQKLYHDLLHQVLEIEADTGAPRCSSDGHRIDVDIPRTMPALHFFACIDTKTVEGVPVTFSPNQQSLRRILYLFAKCNPGLGYVQGMNEIVGHMLYTFATSRDEPPVPPPSDEQKLLDTSTLAASHESLESKDSHLSESSKKASASRVAGGDGTSELVECDVFHCFQTLTAYVGDAFCRALDADEQLGITGAMNTFETMLYCCDGELYRHMDNIQLKPAFYAFRWITVLMTQEFLLPDVLRLWDFFFSFGEQLRAAVFYTAIAMLVAVREELLTSNFPKALQMLQAYPPPEDINDLLNLAEHLMASQGIDLITRIRDGIVKIPVEEDEEPEEKESIGETLNSVASGMRHFFGRMKRSMN